MAIVGCDTIFKMENDAAPVPRLSLEDVIVSEEAGTSIFTVKLSAVSTSIVSVEYSAHAGTADLDKDFILTSGTLIIPAGSMSGTITVTIVDDLVSEGSENFTIDLIEATNAIISDNQGVGTITDNDTVPSISINDITVQESNSGTSEANFIVSLSSAYVDTVQVDYRTINGTAKAPDDYKSASVTTLIFLPGITEQNIQIIIKSDELVEPEETFVVELSNANNASIANKRGKGTIIDKTVTLPKLSINDVTVNEGNSGTVAAIVTVTLSEASTQTVRVDYATANGTAIAPGDYNPISMKTLNFAPGVTTKTISVDVNGDVINEANETFKVKLSNASNAIISDNKGVVTINDNDISSSTELLFEETFEGPDPFSTAHSMDVGDWDYALQFVNSPAFEGSRSARFEIRADQELVSSGKRSEVVIVKGADGEIAENTWYSFAVYFPTDGYAYDSEREIINQWYQGGSPATTLRTDEDRILLETGNELDNRERIDIGPIIKDTWHTFVLHFIHSHGSDGLIEVWYNGDKIITHRGGNMYDDVLPKWKIGLYKSAFKHGTSDVDKRVIFYDHIKVGDENVTYADMIPGN